MFSRVLAVLLLTTAVQLGVWQAARNPKVVSIDVGKPLPARLISLEGKRVHVSAWTVLFLCTNDCTHCHTRASTRDRYGDQNSPYRVLWALVGSGAAARDFAQKEALPPDDIVLVRPPRRLPVEELDIPATPLRVVLNPKGVVADVSLTYRLPDNPTT